MRRGRRKGRKKGETLWTGPNKWVSAADSGDQRRRDLTSVSVRRRGVAGDDGSLGRSLSSS